MNIIDERNRRTIHRKLRKKDYDGLMTLSADQGNWVRLLDEGMVVYADGSPYFYITKGTLRKFYENLSDDYVGSINIGHTDLASFPDRIVGQWSKEDLRLVDIDDGRQGLDVRLNINYEHPLVQALRMAPFDMGVSAEMYTHTNELMERNPDLNPFNVPIIDEVDIRDFAIVGDAGNVGSMGIHLKGGETTLKIEDLQKLLDAEPETLGNLADLLTDAVEVTPEEEPVEAAAEEVSEEETEEETAEEEVAEEETPAEEPTEEADETPSEEAQLAASWREVFEEIDRLRDENAQLRAQLAARDKEEKATLAAWKKLKVSLSDTKPVEKKEVRQYTDGIGD